MKILAISKESENADWSSETDTLKAEAHRVYDLYLDGCLREIYFTEEQDAVLILECESTAKAIELLDTLPLVKRGLISFRVMQLMPYTGYGRILEQ